MTMYKDAMKQLRTWVLKQMKENTFVRLPQICVWVSNRNGHTIGYYIQEEDKYVHFWENISSSLSAMDLREDVEKDIKKMMREIAETTKSRQGKWVFNENGRQSLSLEPKPCKEFGQLQRWLLKYANATLKENSIYNVSLFGKRSTYDESGRRSFIDHNASKCSALLEQLRKVRKSGDKLQMTYKTIDDIDTKTSTYYETECYGTRLVTADVEVTSPKGKHKGTIMIVNY